MKPPKTPKDITATLAGVKPTVTEAEKAAQEKFWKITKTSDDGHAAEVQISTVKMNELLCRLGYYRFDTGPTSYQFVKVSEGARVREISRTHIRDGFFDYLDSLPEFLEKGLAKAFIKEKIFKGVTTHFQTDKMEMLRPKAPIRFVRDTEKEKYMFFQNGYLLITDAGMSLQPYTSLKGHIWESEVLPREWKPADNQQAVFSMFLFRFANSDDARFAALRRIIGYYLHDYHQTDMKALVLTDSKVGDGTESNGRSGKTLFTKGLAYILSPDPEDAANRTIVEINGKDFDAQVKHKYQSAGRETKLIVLNDLKRNFDVDDLYNDVTEGMVVEGKGKDPFRIRAKMILTTNRTLRVPEGSASDRFYEFEASEHFNARHKPRDEFGHWFFTQWDPAEWQRFYAFMAQCVHEYLKAGSRLPKVGQINLNSRKLYEETCTEFVEFMQVRFADGRYQFAPHYDREFDKEYALEKKAMFKDFIHVHDEFSKLTPKKFHQWIVRYTQYAEGFEPFDEKRDSYKSGDEKFIWFRKKIEA